MRQLKIEQRATTRTASISRYFNDVSLNNTMTPEEEHVVATKAATGDQEAIDRLVKANLRFVISVAKQYSRDAESLAELISQGNIGLLEAAAKFDPSRGFKFISFAVWFIRKEILWYLNQNTRSVRIPQNVILDIGRAKKVESRLSTEFGREATDEEVAQEMTRLGWEITPEKLTRIRTYDGPAVPLEPENSEDEWAPILWLDIGASPTEEIEQEDDRRIIHGMLSVLTPLEKEILGLRLGLVDGEPWTYGAIGHRYDRTAEWARQTYEKALKKVKRNVARKQIKPIFK